MADRSKKRGSAKKPAAGKHVPRAKVPPRAGMRGLAWIQFRALRW